MAEHNKNDFEHELEESFRRFDESIKIPEIPDAQSIFERAENEKKNILPFKKYSKIAVAAAAVVLVCVSVPVLANAFSYRFSAENMNVETPMAINEFVGKDAADGASEAFPEDTEVFEEPAESQEQPSEEAEKEKSESDIQHELEAFFSKSSASSTMGDAFYEETTDDVEVIEEYLNKKRSIEITIEKDSVSIVLFDNAAGEEIISAFWVEGTYESSRLDKEIYVVKLVKIITPEDFYGGFYLPMVGDAANGTYTIPEESVSVSDKITKGVIELSVEIHIGTGEYKIYASLV